MQNVSNMARCDERRGRDGSVITSTRRGCCWRTRRSDGPLYAAAVAAIAENGHVGAARLLLDKGAEVDRAKKDGATPLWIACENGHVDAARLLLDKGAEVDRSISDGYEGDAAVDMATRRAAVAGQWRGDRSGAKAGRDAAVHRL